MEWVGWIGGGVMPYGDQRTNSRAAHVISCNERGHRLNRLRDLNPRSQNTAHSSSEWPACSFRGVMNELLDATKTPRIRWSHLNARVLLACPNRSRSSYSFASNR